MRHSADTRRLNSEYVAPYGNQRRRMAFRMSQIGRASDVRGPTLKGWNASIRAGRRRAQFGHQRSFANTPARTFKRRLHPGQRPFIEQLFLPHFLG
jgi:hypothetical protein